MIPYFLILYIVAVVVDALGFINFSWFVSLGYAYSIAAMGITNLILFRKELTFATVILNILAMIYGCRLGTYLYIRGKSSSFINKNKQDKGEEKEKSFMIKISIWLPCAFIYACELSPVFFRLKNGISDDVMAYVGIAVSCMGILFESLGDHQKSAAKKKDPTRYVDTGLYKFVRCPNYLGEILFWTGIILSGTTAMKGVWQWLAACFGYICIVFIMLGAARTLELRQKKSYGNDDRFQVYANSTPILFPFIPIYSFEKYTFLQG